MSQKTDDEALFALFSFFIVLPIAIAFDGYAISKIWNWHVAPALLCANIGFWRALGIATFVQYFGILSNRKQADDSKARLLGSCLARVLLFCAAWAVS